MPQLIDAESGHILVANLTIADRFWPRFVGLQFKRSMESDSGLLLRPCSSIHTCFMRFPIDAIMLDREMCIVGLKQNVAPWRAVICDKKTNSVLETNSNARSWRIGQRLEIV